MVPSMFWGLGKARNMKTKQRRYDKVTSKRVMNLINLIVHEYHSRLCTLIVDLVWRVSFKKYT